MSQSAGANIDRLRAIAIVLVLFVAGAALGGAVAAGSTSASSSIRVNVGGAAYKDSSGNTWSADSGFSGGSTYTNAVLIRGTSDPSLYQSQRWSAGSFSYTFSGLAVGSYQVTLKFAEIAYLGPGKRQFNVAIQGAQVLTNFDVAAQAGFNAALDRTFTANVGSGGTLTIAFTKGAADNPMVNAIQVSPVSPTTTSTIPTTTTSTTTSTTTGPTIPAGTASSFRVNVGGAAYKDSSGNTWSADSGFSGGSTYTNAVLIRGTSDPSLYQSQRWSAGSFSYTFSGLAVGSYQVTLKFAEIAYLGPGKRQFNVAIQGAQVLTNFDVAAQAGFNAALDRTFTANVGSGGTLTIAFTKGAADNPMVNAIQVSPVSPTTTSTVPSTTTSTTTSTSPSTQPPTAPTGLKVAAATTSSVSLSWAPSTGGAGVTGYDVFRGSTMLDTVSGTSYTLGGLACGASYGLGVDAVDASSNHSGMATITASTSPCPSTSPSGVAMPVGNISGWTQIFTDDFTTNVPLGSFPAAVSGKWSAYPYPWKGTPTTGTYYPEKTVSIHDGMMDIWLHTETINGTAMHLIAAVMPKINGPSGSTNQLYGRYVIRYKTDTFGYFHASWLLWPASDVWPGDGEIDFPEADFNSNSSSAFMHWQNGTSGGSQDAYTTNVPMSGAWHTAVIEWLATRCTFILDGKVIGQSTSRIPNTPMHWVIQNGVSPSTSTPPNSVQGHIYIDWAAVYKPSS